MAVGFSIINPLHESTDEIRHYRYVRYLLDYRSLPVQDSGIVAHHPPLYYTLAALASSWVKPDHPLYFSLPGNPHWGYRYWEVDVDNKNQYLHGADEGFPYQGDALIAHLARWVNVLVGLGTVLLAYRMGRVIFPDHRATALGALAFVAFNPMFLYMSGAINNDVIAALTGVAVSAACAEIIARGVTLRRAAGLGAVYGLALIAKFNLVFILGLIEFALLADAWSRRKVGELYQTHAESSISGVEASAGNHLKARLQWKFSNVGRLVWANLAVLGVATLVSGWWFVRNQVLYGEPTGFQRVTALWGVRDPRTSLPLAISELPYTWTSLWGRFGYGQIPMPEWAYTSLKIAAGLALIGWGVQVTRLWRARSASRHFMLNLCLLVANVLSFAGVLFGYMLVSPAGAMGRFFFPALPALGLCMFYGLSALVPAHRRGWLAFLCLAAMAGLSLYTLIGILRPAYARPAPLSEEQIASIPHPTQAVFGNQARLLGYEVSIDQSFGLAQDELQPGDEFVVTVYWQALAPSAPDLTVFVHLISHDGPLIAQRDTYPGLGRFPASLWQPGDTFSDRYRIVLDPYTYAPDVADVTVGMYIPGSERLPVTDAEGHEIGTVITLTQVTIHRAETDTTLPEGTSLNPTHINFDNKLALVGYGLSARSVYAGQPLTLTLHWQVLEPIEHEYMVFAQVLGEDYQRWAADDGFPHVKPKRTWKWKVGWIYEDVRVLRLAPDTPPGIYPIEFGLFGGPDNERLPVLAEDGQQVSDHLQLTQIRVK